MVQFENDCVGCPQGCGFCGANHTPHFYCDMCDDEVDELFDYDEKQICESCLLKSVPKISVL